VILSKGKKFLDLFFMLKSNPVIEIKPWKGHGLVFSWMTFVNNFENKLILVEREYLSEKRSEEIKNRKPLPLKMLWKGKPERKSKLLERES
jgi:hypothetical protein